MNLSKKNFFNGFLIFKFFGTLLLYLDTSAYLFSPEERSCYVFRPETIVPSLLLLMVLSFKVIFNHTSKRQFGVLHFRTWWYFRKHGYVQYEIQQLSFFTVINIIIYLHSEVLRFSSNFFFIIMINIWNWISDVVSQ